MGSHELEVRNSFAMSEIGKPGSEDAIALKLKNSNNTMAGQLGQGMNDFVNKFFFVKYSYLFREFFLSLWNGIFLSFM